MHFPNRTVAKAILYLAATCLLATTGVFAAVNITGFKASLGVENAREHLWPAASTESDQIKTKVVVTKRRKRGNAMDVDFRIEFEGVPLGKEYFTCFRDMGMHRDGVNKPSCLGQTMPPSNEGKLIYNFNSTTMSQEEWVQITIRSTDGKIQKSARFTPFK